MGKYTPTVLELSVRTFSTAAHHFSWVAITPFRRHKMQYHWCQEHIFCICCFLCHRSVCKNPFFSEKVRLVSLYKRVTAKSTEDLDGVFGFRLMYVLWGQMGMSQKPSGVAGTHRRESDTPHHHRKMHGQGRWGPRVNNLVRNCATVRLLAGHRVLRRSCLNFSTSKLLRCPPICQLSQDSLPIRCY